MIQSKYEEFQEDKRPLTLNALRQQQYSLSRLLLLAIQTGDMELQEKLKTELEEKADCIERMNAGIKPTDSRFV